MYPSRGRIRPAASILGPAGVERMRTQGRLRSKFDEFKDCVALAPSMSNAGQCRRYLGLEVLNRALSLIPGTTDPKTSQLTESRHSGANASR